MTDKYFEHRPALYSAARAILAAQNDNEMSAALVAMRAAMDATTDEADASPVLQRARAHHMQKAFAAAGATVDPNEPGDAVKAAYAAIKPSEAAHAIEMVTGRLASGARMAYPPGPGARVHSARIALAYLQAGKPWRDDFENWTGPRLSRSQAETKCQDVLSMFGAMDQTPRVHVVSNHVVISSHDDEASAIRAATKFAKAYALNNGDRAPDVWRYDITLPEGFNVARVHGSCVAEWTPEKGRMIRTGA